MTVHTPYSAHLDNSKTKSKFGGKKETVERKQTKCFSVTLKVAEQLNRADGIHCVHYEELSCTLHRVNRIV